MLVAAANRPERAGSAAATAGEMGERLQKAAENGVRGTGRRLGGEGGLTETGKLTEDRKGLGGEGGLAETG